MVEYKVVNEYGRASSFAYGIAILHVEYTFESPRKRVSQINHHYTIILHASKKNKELTMQLSHIPD